MIYINLSQCKFYFNIYFNTTKKLNILDIWTGRGWFPILIKKYFPQHSISAADVDFDPEVIKRFKNL